MMQTLKHYPPDRTAQIMSRYRPIAPKPGTPNPNHMADGCDHCSAVPTGILKSPYLRTVWAHLQARPTRTRKRGRSAGFAPPSVKRARACLQGLIPPPGYHHLANSPAGNLAANWNFVQIKCNLDTAVTTLAESVELPLHNRAPPVPAAAEKVIDLNQSAGTEEMDLLAEMVRPNVISPRPIRPVGSTVVVERISYDIRPREAAMVAEEVEEMVEAVEDPAIVSDSSNRVRMCNAAYKELVGQPECGWLDCARGGACRRIGGGISLRFEGATAERCMHGFSGCVRIEWEREGAKRCLKAFCDVVKLGCEAKDFQFLWRFHVMES